MQLNFFCGPGYIHNVDEMKLNLLKVAVRTPTRAWRGAFPERKHQAKIAVTFRGGPSSIKGNYYEK